MKKTPSITHWQIIILFLSVYVILGLFIETVFRLPEDVSSLLTTVDNFVCFIFLADFFYRISQKDRLNYLKWGWIDFVSSIPNLEVLRWGRFVRMVRLFRILRGVRSVKVLIKHLFANRAKGTFYTVTMVSFLLVVSSSIAILHVEVRPDSNIQNPADALWWAFVTITTVGYGDHFPITLEGRFLAALLMTAGVGLFGTFTAYVASLFIEDEERKEEQRDDEIIKAMKDIKERLDRIEETLMRKET